MPQQFECDGQFQPRSDLERKETILIVEDEECVRQVAREILELEGYFVLTAAHPHEALEEYEQYGATVDLLLTDIVMPGVDGHDLAEKLAQKQPSIKSIFMSGYTENTLLRRGVRDLRMMYLQKPFTLQALVSKVQQVLGAQEARCDVQNGAQGSDSNEVAL